VAHDQVRGDGPLKPGPTLIALLTLLEIARVSRLIRGSLALRPLLLTIIILLNAQESLAQSTTVTFTPPNPTAADVITARITFQGLACAYVPETVVNGSSVRMTIAISDCFTGPPPSTITEFVPFGPLPAGMYTYELYFQHESEPPMLQVQQPLVVAAAAAPAAVPTVAEAPLLVLAALLALTGLMLLRRS